MYRRIMIVCMALGALGVTGASAAAAETMEKPKVSPGDYYSKTYKTTFSVKGRSDARPVAEYDFNLWTVKRGGKTVVRHKADPVRPLIAQLAPGRYTAKRVNRYAWKPTTTWGEADLVFQNCRVFTTQSTPLLSVLPSYRLEADVQCGSSPITYTGRFTVADSVQPKADTYDVPRSTVMTYTGSRVEFADTARVSFRVRARNSPYITQREWRHIKIGMSRDSVERIIGSHGWAEYTSANVQVRGYRDDGGYDYFVTYSNGRVFSKH